MDKSFRLFFLIVGILCCLTLVGYSASVSRTSDGEIQREESHLSLGLPFSPWFESRKTLEDGRVVSSRWRIHLLSWTWPVFLVGVGSLMRWHRLRPGRRSVD